MDLRLAPNECRCSLDWFDETSGTGGLTLVARTGLDWTDEDDLGQHAATLPSQHVATLPNENVNQKQRSASKIRRPHEHDIKIC